MYKIHNGTTRTVNTRRRDRLENRAKNTRQKACVDNSMRQTVLPTLSMVVACVGPRLGFAPPLRLQPSLLDHLLLFALGPKLRLSLPLLVFQTDHPLGCVGIVPGASLILGSRGSCQNDPRAVSGSCWRWMSEPGLFYF